MYRVVLDANQLVSAFINKGGYPAKILDLFMEGRFEAVVSPSIIAEIENVLNYPRLKKRHGKTNREIKEFLSLFTVLCINVSAEGRGVIVEDDPTDDKYIFCALNGKADFIISGDRHLLNLISYKNVKMLTARKFLGIMK